MTKRIRSRGAFHLVGLALGIALAIAAARQAAADEPPAPADMAVIR